MKVRKLFFKLGVNTMVEVLGTIGVFAFSFVIIALFTDFCLKDAAKEEKPKKIEDVEC